MEARKVDLNLRSLARLADNGLPYHRQLPTPFEKDLDYNAKDKSVVKQTVHGSHVAVY